ncbi:MAG: MarR family winged helix-turn-helix transcriptional regulator [Thermomicrobiales bacterium]
MAAASPGPGQPGPGQRLFQIVRFWSRRWTGAGQGADLDNARMVMVTEAVLALQGGPGATVNAVANELGIDQSGASRMIAQAEAAGYLRKAPGQSDARQRALHVTPAGEDLLAAAHAWQEAVFASLTAGWDAEDVQRLAGYLARLQAAQADGRQPSPRA